MNTTPKLSFVTLLLLISFASVNAVLFTPALPAIAAFFHISEAKTQQTITWFLIGYALGQLVYGPIANRYGRKKALYVGIILQIISSFICIAAGLSHMYFLLVLGRFFLALGSGVGLKMSFTLVNETYEPVVASKKISHLMLAFAITPALSVMLGGLLSTYFGWTSTFYATALYGVMLLLFVFNLPETQTKLDFNALKLKHLLNAYLLQFKNSQLILGGLLMGLGTCFVYVFAALAPFIAINLMHLKASTYGTLNLIPPAGLILGSLSAPYLTKKFQHKVIIKFGIISTCIGTLLMFSFLFFKFAPMFALFMPMIFCYFGLSLIFANASTLAMSHTTDKAHGSAVMNFVNMGLTTIVVLNSNLIPISLFQLPIIFIIISLVMLVLQRFVNP